jgi:hypothetical protein
MYSYTFICHAGRGEMGNDQTQHNNRRQPVTSHQQARIRGDEGKTDKHDTSYHEGPTKVPVEDRDFSELRSSSCPRARIIMTIFAGWLFSLIYV